MGVPENTYGDDLNFPWRQFISKNGWTGDLSYGPEGIICAETLQIKGEDLESALRDILGYSTQSKTDGTKITRKLPMAHPRFPWLFANKIVKVDGIRPAGPEAFTATHGSLMTYKLLHVTIQFATPSYRVLADNLVDEWERFVTKYGKSTAEFITREEGSLVWAVGARLAGETFTGAQSQLLTKRRLQWTWHKVPEVGWLDSNGIPTNYQNGLGRVNIKDFAGFPAGTLLMEAADNEQPEMQTDFDGLQTKPTSNPVGGLPRVFNIPLNFVYFDPVRKSTIFARGHNLAPDPGDGLWYLVHNGTHYTNKSGNATSGSKVVTGIGGGTSGLVVGSVVKYAGTIPNETQIESIDSASQITLTRAATATGSPTLQFFLTRYPGYDFAKIFQLNDV